MCQLTSSCAYTLTMGEPVPWLTPEEQRAWRSFVRLQERLGGRLAHLLQTESHVSSADFSVLVQLTDVPEGRRRFLDLAQSLEWEKSRMSHHLSRMVKRGLVVREECPEDGRGAFIVITDAGRALLAAAAPRHVEAVRALFLDHVTPAELRTLAQLSDRVVEKLNEDQS